MRTHAIALLALAACSSSSPVTDSGLPPDAAIVGPVDPPVVDLVQLCGANPATPDDWERCYQKRKCEWEVGCVPLTTFRDVKECIDLGDAVQDGRLVAERRERMRAVAEGRASVDVEAFSRCLVETAPDRCATALYHPSCATRFAGTIASGQACRADIECASPGAHCQRACSDACCEGVCVAAPKEGEKCADLHGCEPGFQCHTVCIAGDVDTPCGSDRDCDQNAWCDLRGSKTCRADLPAGAVCEQVLQCSGETSCVGVGVAGVQPTCTRINKPGDACDFYCLGGLYCAFPGQGLGVCTAMPALGEACSALVSCSGVNTICDGAHCVARAAEGKPCTTTPAGATTCLAGMFCTDELGAASPVCARRQADGQACTRREQCQSFLCSGTTAAAGECLPWRDSCPAPVVP
jgi:hypothetical protein